ncbi:MarR family winged helix-turn-helix transcriptional regulator [Fredinandcohnia sp. 179-A 10B2 NHS]|uniref:MarR family winged helix-turn-helix transcriptional regulator n=1 Tax=Fredinandcohnia sp. 179-A 10B2 NHS TaxID=3235176 RepID=UPI0039A2131C
MSERIEFIRESIDFLHCFMVKSIQRYAEEHGLTAPQLKVIEQVLIHESISIKQLTQNLRMTQSTVSDIVERLSARGILIKTPNPRDKRSVVITISEEKLKVIKEAAPKPLNRAIKGALSVLSEAEQETVEQGMRLLLSAVREKMDRDGMEQLESFNFLFFQEDKVTDG